MTPKQRKAKRDITESKLHCRTIIKSYQHAVQDYPRAVKVQTARVAEEQRRLAELVARFEAAPSRITLMEQRLRQLKVEEHTVLVKPKLDRLAKLRSEVARLEKECSS